MGTVLGVGFAPRRLSAEPVFIGVGKMPAPYQGGGLAATSKGALVRQYAKLFELEGCRLEFTPSALREIARGARQRETGARGLRAVVEEMMLDVMFNLPSVKRKDATYVVTPEVVRGQRDLFATAEKASKAAAGRRKARKESA